ncbi:MAG: hypothetical protein MI923_22590 [Phycisphaerales bacterium]|nr:hypothetical protein [Phycisphaerales bacterium]
MSKLWRLCRKPLLVFVTVGAVYSASIFVGGHTESPKLAYYDALARAFLQGRLDLNPPPHTHDLTHHENRWYVPFPPLPALILLPWAATGLPINAVYFSVLIGALNAMLVYLFLRALRTHGFISLDDRGLDWLTWLFAFGTVHWYVSLEGTVWFLAQICTVTGIACAAWFAAAGRSPWLVGAALGVAMLGRPHVVFVWIFLLGMGLEHNRKRPLQSYRLHTLHWAGASLVCVFFAVAGLLAYNQARFGNPLDFGYRHQNVDAGLRGKLGEIGQFHVRYVKHNAWVMFAKLPHWDAQRRMLTPDLEGMSLLVSTPALLLLWAACKRRPWVIGAWFSVGLIMVPLLCYYNTGWMQFGYRFSLDFWVPVIALLSLAAGKRVGWVFRSLCLLSLVINAWGTGWWLTTEH